MTLGNELKMNFMISKSALDASASYYAVVTKTNYDKENAATTVTETIPMTQWETYASVYYKVTCGVAAKEMCTDMTVAVYKVGDAENPVESRTDSIRAYAMRALERDDVTAAIKKLMVDMLNYGAAAQNHFGLNTDDLANSLLTDEQKALGTASMKTCTNKQQKIANCYGSSLSLDDAIKFNVFFFNMPEDVTGYYGTVSFTNHLGEAINVKLTENDLFRAGSNAVKNLCQVIVDDIVLADARQLVTVTVYDADGNVYGQCADSVESYVRRGINSIYSDLLVSTMKFADSAYDYLHNR